MKLFENCLIACDIDGTLMTNGVIPQANKEKIKFFVENGGDFALATGRSLCAVSDVFAEIDEIYFGAFANGVVIYDRKNDKFLFNKTIDKADYDIMYKIKETFPEIGMEVHYQKNVGVFNRTTDTDLHEKYEKMPTVVLEKNDVDNLGLNKVLYTLPSFDYRDRLMNFIEKIPTNCDFLDTTVTYYGEQRFFIEQVPKGISKAIGIKKLAELLGTKGGCIYAIGDYYNDIKMLAAADISAAPDGSPEEIKKNVDYVTKSAENGAVADFIDYLAKIRR